MTKPAEASSLQQPGLSSFVVLATRFIVWLRRRCENHNIFSRTYTARLDNDDMDMDFRAVSIFCYWIDRSAEIEALIQQLNHHYDSVEITILPVDLLTLLTEDDKKFLSYEHILFLATPAQGTSSEKIDSETLLALLFLENRVRKYETTKIVPPQIIAQILHPENSDLLAANSAIQGVVISNEICSIIAARISEDPRSAELLSILFDEQSSEIYLKPATLYFKTLDTADRLSRLCKRPTIVMRSVLGSGNIPEEMGAQAIRPCSIRGKTSYLP